METFAILVPVLSIAAIAVAFIFLVRGALRQMRKVGRTMDSLSDFLQDAQKELTTTTRELRSTLNDLDRVAATTASTVERIDRVTAGAERLLDGAQIASSAAKALRSSSVGITSVYEGVKQGIRTLVGFRETDKGGTSDE